MGIVGVCIIINDMIDTFLLSCRALGRNVEKQMLKIVSYKGLKAKYIPSDKNHQVKSFYQNNGFELIDIDNLTSMYIFKKIDL